MKKNLLIVTFCLLSYCLFPQIGAQQKAIQNDEKLFRIEKNYKDNRTGFMNRSGELKIPCIYEQVGDFKEGVTYFKEDSKFGLINTKGEIVLPPEYDSPIYQISSGVGTVEKDGKYGLVSTKGKIIIPPTYDDLGLYNDGLVAVKINEKWGYMNLLGKIIITPKFQEAYIFREGLAKVIVEKNDKFLDGGFINKQGQIVIPCRLYTGNDNTNRSEDGFYQGLARASLDGSNWGYINKIGIFVIKPIYSGANNFKEGLAGVYKGDGINKPFKGGYINAAGKVVIDFREEFGGDFIEGLLKVTYPNKKGWAFIDKTGKVVIEPKYSISTDFEGGLARVIDENRESFYIDKKGSFFHSYYSEDVLEDVINMSVGNSGSTYTGKLKNGKADGFGKSVDSDGSWYEGYFHNWLRNGFGTYRGNDGKRYTGNFVDDKAEGVFQVKQWTLGGLVANEWYVKFEDGIVISSEQTKSDFDDFIKGSNSRGTSNANSSSYNEETEKKSSSVNSPEIVTIEVKSRKPCAYVDVSYEFNILEDGKTVASNKTISMKKNGDWQTNCGDVFSSTFCTSCNGFAEAIKKYYKYQFSKTPKSIKIEYK